jgi:hypothetical protein
MAIGDGLFGRSQNLGAGENYTAEDNGYEEDRKA